MSPIASFKASQHTSLRISSRLQSRFPISVHFSFALLYARRLNDSLHGKGVMQACPSSEQQIGHANDGLGKYQYMSSIMFISPLHPSTTCADTKVDRSIKLVVIFDTERKS